MYSIVDLDEFKQQFCGDLASSLGIDSDRIGIRGITAGSTIVNFAFTPGEPGQPTPADLMKNVMGLLTKSLDDLPGCLKSLMPDFIPVASSTVMSGVMTAGGAQPQQSATDASIAKIVDPSLLETLSDQFDLVQPAIQSFRRKALSYSDKWMSDQRRLGIEDRADGVPVHEFEKIGYMEAIPHLRELMVVLKGDASNRARSIHIQTQNHSTDMRRKLGQIMTELVWDRAHVVVKPELKSRIANLG